MPYLTSEEDAAVTCAALDKQAYRDCEAELVSLLPEERMVFVERKAQELIQILTEKKYHLVRSASEAFCRYQTASEMIEVQAADRLQRSSMPIAFPQSLRSGAWILYGDYHHKAFENVAALYLEGYYAPSMSDPVLVPYYHGIVEGKEVTVRAGHIDWYHYEWGKRVQQKSESPPKGPC